MKGFLKIYWLLNNYQPVLRWSVFQINSEMNNNWRWPYEGEKTRTESPLAITYPVEDKQTKIDNFVIESIETGHDDPINDDLPELRKFLLQSTEQSSGPCFPSVFSDLNYDNFE